MRGASRLNWRVNMRAAKSKPGPPAAPAGQASGPTVAGQTPGPATDKPRRGWLIAAIAALAVAAAAATFTEVQNYDIFWHLASGDWMLAHGRVLATDPFSIDPLPQWVNVHWLFQVIVSSLYAAGGFAALVGLKTLLGAATVIILAVAARRCPAGVDRPGGIAGTGGARDAPGSPA
jgi:hypothetical protein